MKHIKPIIMLSLFLLELISFSGCGINRVKEETKLLKEAKKETSVFFEFLKNEDIEGLSNLFNQNKKNTHNLNKEWQTFFDDIDGKITDYERMTFTETRKEVSEGKITYLVVQAEFKDVKTDTGQVYGEMKYSKIIKANYDTNLEGINDFTLWKEKDNYDNPFIIGGKGTKLDSQNSNS